MKPGKYRAKALEGTFTESEQKKTPMVAVRFELIETKETIWHMMYLTEKTKERTFDTLYGTLGMNDAPLIQRDNGEWFDQTHLADKEVELVLEEEEYEGKKRIRVQWVNEIGGGMKFAGVPVTKVLGGMDLRAEAAAARARKGVSASEDQIPF